MGKSAIALYTKNATLDRLSTIFEERFSWSLELADSARCLVIDANNLTPIIASTQWNGEALAQDRQSF